LLHNLNVRPILDSEGNPTGDFEVPAGGRRYRALQLLVKQKRLPNDVIGGHYWCEEIERPAKFARSIRSSKKRKKGLGSEYEKSACETGPWLWPGRML